MYEFEIQLHMNFYQLYINTVFVSLMSYRNNFTLLHYLHTDRHFDSMFSQVLYLMLHILDHQKIITLIFAQNHYDPCLFK